MSKREDGGPAFPQFDCSDGENPTMSIYGGMTLRDYFAAEALDGIIRWANSRVTSPDEEIMEEAALHAKRAYIYADAMLKVRKA